MNFEIVEIKIGESKLGKPLRYGKLACGHTQLVRSNRTLGNLVKCGQCKKEYQRMMRSVYPTLFL